MAEQDLAGINYVTSIKKMKFTVISNQNLPFPKTGKVPVLTTVLHFLNKQETVRVLLDTGSTLPIISDNWAIRHELPVAKRQKRKPVQDYAGREVEGLGKYFTSPLILQYMTNFTKDSYEIAPVIQSYDIILHDWWIREHQINLYKGLRSFTSTKCRENCTKEKHQDTLFE